MTDFIKSYKFMPIFPDLYMEAQMINNKIGI